MTARRTISADLSVMYTGMLVGRKQASHRVAVGLEGHVGLGLIPPAASGAEVEGDVLLSRLRL